MRKNVSLLSLALANGQGRRRRAIALALAAVCLMLLFPAAHAWAQSTDTGTVVGVVTDPSGAVVSHATVTLTDHATKTTRTATTNNAGRYVFVSIPPSTYDISVKQPGFAEARIDNQVLEVGRQLTVNVPLKVGESAQQVTVEATVSQLQTLNATVGNTVNGIALQSLPSLGRDVSTFVTLQPAVSPDGSVAGTVVDQSSFMLDGGNNTNDMDGSMQVYTPSFAGDPTGGVIANPNGNFAAAGPTGVMPTPADSVEEFKVATTNQTADFNNSSGMQVSVVTKRGTDAWHGTGYEYYLDNNFSANTWDNNLVGVPVPNYHYSRFGAAIGGPIIPKKILGGKTYFFTNYQGWRFPNSETYERAVPSAAMRSGIVTNPDTGAVLDLKALDPRGIGINPLVQQMWNKYMPAGNDPSCGSLLGSRCDGVNAIGFKANLAIPQSDNFSVVRLDHDFGSKWHFMSSYRYYALSRSVHQQVDIGGFFPGDKLGVPASTANRPQQPWYLVAGLTTNITSNTTNDFHYSFLRNWWQWSSRGDPPQLTGLAGALEPFGESRTLALTPYNVDTQNTRTRFWDGQDHFFRDDISMLKGNHLFQFGGQYQHNYNWHQRTDNGGGINYYTVYQLGDSSGSGLVDLGPTLGASTALARDVAAVYGIVTASQVAYTRSGANLALNPPLTPAFDKSTIPYYNVYFSDTWHMKPSFTLTYGLGWTLEMPPTEKDGKQVEFVDEAGQPIDTKTYLFQRQAAALKGQVYNPVVGYALVGNTANHLKYPYNPFYGSFSPRIAAAWNPDLGERFGGKNTVFRAGYGRIYGRLNGVDLVLVPLLGTGLIQPVQCRLALSNGACGPATPTLANAFRIGVDGLAAPLPAASPTLPQPLFPGINDVSAAAGEALDPNFRPNSVDSFDLTIQHQIGSKLTVEAGFISRWIHNEYQPININAVPYMMTLGGQQFAKAYAAVEQAMGCTSSVGACKAATIGSTLAKLAPQPFFEAALAGTGFCNGFANCTTAIVNQQFGNFKNQAVWDLWSALDNGGGAGSMGWNFPRSMLNSPLPTALGSNGQISGGVGVNASIGHGNYNAGFLSLRSSSWHGLTMQHNFTWSKALGTGAYVQATSQYTAVDPFDLNTGYGIQPFDRKFVYTSFFVYQPPFRRDQRGILGHLLGGWNFAPVFAAGSGAPIACNLNTGAGGNVNSAGGSGSEEFGAGDASNFFTNASCIFSRTPGGISAHLNIPGGTDAFGNTIGTATAGPGNAAVNIFSNPVATWNNVRAPILGFDRRIGGTGPFYGLPYWNLDLSIRKMFKITERVNTEAQVVFTNVLNHNQFLDPTLDITSPSTWGVLNTQGSTPRQMEFGFRVSF